MLNLGVGRLPHGICRVNNSLLPFNLPVHLVDKVIIVHRDERPAAQACSLISRIERSSELLYGNLPISKDDELEMKSRQKG